MIALDTNVLLRLLLNDDAAQTRKARQAVELVEAEHVACRVRYREFQL